MGKELLEWFGYSEKTVSVSAFVQQRNKIKPETLKHIFQTMVSQCDKHTLYNGYRLLAIDGSDLETFPPIKEKVFPISKMMKLQKVIIYYIWTPYMMFCSTFM